MTITAERNAPAGRPVSGTSRLAGGMGWTTMGVAVAGGAQFLVLAILARYLIDEEMGVVQAALVIMGLGRLMVRSGAGEALVQRSELESRHLGAASVLAVGFGLVISLVVAGTSMLSARLFDMGELTELLRIASIAFVIQAIGIVPESLLQRDLRFALLAKIEVVSQLLGFALVGGVLAYSGLGAWSFIIAFVAQACMKTILMLIARPPHGIGMPDADAYRSILSFGGGLALGRVTNYAATRGDYVVTSQTLGPGPLGIYGNAYQLVYTPALLLGEAIDRVMFPVLSGMQTDTARLGPAFLRGIRTAIILTAPLAVFGLVLAPELVELVLGPGWDGVVVPVQILAIGLPARTAYKLSDSLTKAVGVVYARASLHALYAVMIVTGSWIGSRWGVTGVATGVLLAVIANHVVLASLSLRTADLRWGEFFRAHRRGLTLGVMTAVPTWLLAEGLRCVTESNLIVAAGTLLTMSSLAAGLVLAAPLAVLGCRAGQLFQIDVPHGEHSGAASTTTAKRVGSGAAAGSNDRTGATSPIRMVEFVGLPGSGKSHVADLLGRRLTGLGFDVRRPDLDIDESTPKPRRVVNKIASATRTALTRPLTALGLLRIIVRSRQRSVVDIGRRWINLLNTIGASSAAARQSNPRVITVSSQGIAQSIWSVALMAEKDEVDALFARCAQWCPDVMVLIDADQEVALAGMQSRPGAASRIERITDNGDRFELLTKGTHLRDQIVDSFKASCGADGFLHLVHNNRTDDDLDEQLSTLARHLCVPDTGAGGAQ